MSLLDEMTALADAVREASGAQGKLGLQDMRLAIKGLTKLNLNLTVYESEETLLVAEATDNTIALVTAEAVTDWAVVDALPEGMAEGCAYILVGSKGTAELVLADRVTMHLQEARVNGSRVVGYLRKAGEWVRFGSTWDGYYFKDGNQYTEITGGWVNQGAGTATIGAKLAVLAKHYDAGDESAQIGTKLAVDLTDVTTLYWDSPGGSGGYSYGAYFQIRTDGAITREAYVGVGQGSMDVSDLTGSYYLVLRTMSGGSGHGYGDLRAVWRD